MSHASTAAAVFVDAASGSGPGALSTPIAVHAGPACSGPPDEGLQQAYQQMSATFTTDELLEQAMQQIAKLRGDLHCLRAQRADDLFRTGNSNGGTANDNQQAAQHTAPVTVTALAQVRAKYLEAVANAQPQPTTPPKRVGPNMRIEPAAKAGLTALAMALGADTRARGNTKGTVIPLPLPHQ
jgi:hypothetical protein